MAIHFFVGAETADDSKCLVLHRNHNAIKDLVYQLVVHPVLSTDECQRPEFLTSCHVLVLKQMTDVQS